MAEMKESKAGLSVIVLTKNEEANLPGCLESLKFARQVVVVDCQSRDRTAALARRAGADVFVRPWPGFTAQRNFALSKCRHDWVLSVDADERISAPLAAEITALLAGPESSRSEGYQIPEVNNYFGRWLRRGGIYPGEHLILFRRRLGRYSSGSADVHEGVRLKRVGRLKGHLIHFAYPEVSLAIAKLNHYTDLEARGKLAAGARVRGWKMAWSPLERFIKSYFFKLGFLDGVQGFIYCMQLAYYSFLIQAKVWESTRAPLEREPIG